MLAAGEVMSSSPKDGFIIIHDDISGESIGTDTNYSITPTFGTGAMTSQAKLITSVAFTTL